MRAGEPQAVAFRVMTRTSLVVALLAAAIAPAGASAATIDVTTTADSGPGSLRQAITAAQAAGPDDIVFAAGVTGAIDIGPAQLPMLSTGTTVTATRTGGVPDVELHCTAPSVGTGLQAGAGQTGVAITGVSITNCTNGVFVLAGGGLTLRGSWIGRSRTGTTAGNTANGVAAIAGASLVVGGPSAGDGNLIVGNAWGVAAAAPAAGAVVRGNTISGSGANGVEFTDADGVVVQDNLVAGSAASDIIFFRGAGARIQGNRVGTDAAGATAQPSGLAGINLRGTVDAIVGGAGPGEANVVAGVPGDGHCGICVQALDGVRATRTVVAGNRIGTTASGLAGLTPGGVRRGPRHRRRRHDRRRHRAGRRQPRRRVHERRDQERAGLDRDGGAGQHRRPAGRRVGRDPQRRRHLRCRRRLRHPHRRTRRQRRRRQPHRHLRRGPGHAGRGQPRRPRRRTAARWWATNRASSSRARRRGCVRAANIVAGNGLLGVALKNTAGAVVAANVIGRTADGAESRPNGAFGGVMLVDNSGGVVGGDAPGDANLIDGGVNPSIRAEGANQLGTQLLGNRLRGTSHSLGIDLVPLAVTANDPGDADTGPNGLQNAPVVTRARPTAVTGRIDTKPSTAARIQLFSSSADGRETYALLGEASVTTDGAGAAAFSIPVASKKGTPWSRPRRRATAPRSCRLRRACSSRATASRARGSASSAGSSACGSATAPAPTSACGSRRRTRGRKLKAVTKKIRAGRTGRFQLKLPASTRRKLAATRRRKGKATYRPRVTVSNLTSGVKKTYKPRIKVR